ncbi:MAG: EF-hand domain-containing protein [Pirellulales bacterium]
MRSISRSFVLVCLLMAATTVLGQQPGNPPGGNRGSVNVEMFVARLMNFDQNGDGRLSKDEITDPRLQAMLARADADGDGTVSKDELTEMMTKEITARGAAGAGGRGPGGPRGGPGGVGPGGPGFEAPPKVGQILPEFVRDSLELNARQKKMLEALQADVDERLAKILTADQMQQVEAMQRRGPGGPGGPGGPPPDGDRPPRRPGGQPGGPPASE